MSSQSGSEFVEYDSECYEVECIRERRIFKGKKQYFIKWKDWDEKYNTWEPIENLQTVLGMVNAFEKQYEQGNVKKDSNLKQYQSSESALKKTKPIEKQKKKRKTNQEMQQSQSEEEVVQMVQTKEKKSKKDDKKEGKKSTGISNNNEMQMQREKVGEKVLVRQKEVERQKIVKDVRQRQKQKQKQKQVPIIKKTEVSSLANTNKAPQQPSSQVNLPKPPSKSISEPYSGDIIEITGINYHILIPPELPHLPAKLYYNVNRRNKITKKPLAVIDVPSQELLHKCPQMIIRHLQSFAIEVEFYSYQKKQYQNSRQYQGQSSTVVDRK